MSNEAARWLIGIWYGIYLVFMLWMAWRDLSVLL